MRSAGLRIQLQSQNHAWRSQRSEHKQYTVELITMSVYDERFKSLILPSKLNINVPLDIIWWEPEGCYNSCALA